MFLFSIEDCLADAHLTCGQHEGPSQLCLLCIAWCKWKNRHFVWIVNLQRCTVDCPVLTNVKK